MTSSAVNNNTAANKEFAGPLVVALVTFMVYLPALKNGFVNWDDNVYIYENVMIRNFNLKFIAWAFTSFDAFNWHPLTWVSHALDYAVWGSNPLGHHLTSIFFHSLDTFLVALLAFRLLDAGDNLASGKRISPEGRLIAAAVAGLLFGLHPVHVESVAWVSERKTF